MQCQNRSGMALAEAFIDEQKASRLCLGSESFRDRVATWYNNLTEGKPRPEDIAFRRTGRLLSAERILEVVCERLAVDRKSLQRRRRGTFDRAVASRMLCDHGGLTQRQAADLLGLRSGAAVSQQLQRLAEETERNRPLQKQLTTIAKGLQNSIG